MIEIIYRVDLNTPITMSEQEAIKKLQNFYNSAPVAFEYSIGDVWVVQRETEVRRQQTKEVNDE